tara:strand:- start:70559 stop:71995 length:1437 start_codon:yes stop_codon:yes gene_type:complete
MTVETLPAIKANNSFVVGKGCPTNDPARNVALASNNKANNLSAIAKNVGMTQKCQQAAHTHSNQFMMNTKAAMVVLIGAGALSNTTTNNSLDNSMTQSGCGAFALTANTMMNETNNITCNINSTFSSQTQTAKVGASINLKTIRPTPDAIKEITDHITKSKAIIADMTSPKNLPKMGVPEGWQASWGPPSQADMKNAYDTKMKLIQNSIDQANESLRLYITQNPTSAGVFGSNINLKLKQSIKMSSSQRVSSEVHTRIQNSVRNIAAAVAFNKVSQVAGVNSLTSNSKQFLQNKVTQAVKNQQNNIKSQISQNTMSLDADGSINMTYAGPIVNSTIIANLSSQAEMQINQVITSAVTIGQQVAAELINKIASTTSADSKDPGLDEMIKQANDGLAKQIEISDAGQNKFFEGFFSMIGNIWLMLGIAVVAVLMFFPGVAKVIAPGPLKYVLIAVLMYLIFAYFIGFWPFGKSEEEGEEE